MLMELLNRLETEWVPALAERGVKLRPPLQLIKIGDPAAQAQKVTALVFDAGSAEPLMVLKAAEGETYRRFLLEEYQALSALSVQPDLTGRIPQPIAFFEYNGILAALEGILPGVSLLEYLQIRVRRRPVEVRQDLMLACDFLLRLRKSTRLEQVLPPVDMRARLAALEAVYGPLELPPNHLAWLLEQEKVFNASRILQSACHGDYWPGNLLLTAEGIGVIDWEGYRQSADPFFDLFFFITTYVLNYPWHGWQNCTPEEAFALGFLEHNWLSETMREYLLTYFTQLNLSPTLTAFAYQNFLLEMSLPGAIEHDPRRPPQYEQWFSFYRCFVTSPFNVLQ